MDENFWVFAYGSLIWQPGFDYVEACKATLNGWHRAMCILSTHYRGCAETPGLVLGLDRGGSCRGLAYRVADDQAEAVQGYLHDREMITGVYRPCFMRLRLQDGRQVSGYAFVARRDHAQYAGPLGPDKAAQLIRQGNGCTGSSRDYLASTVAHLDALGLHDESLRHLLHLVDAAG
jgi:cation transport protein ChaC